jgi:hypothetical protein
MKDSFIAYTAGILDGEGSIQINPAKNTNGIRYWGLTIQIASTNKNLIKKLKKVWKMGWITKWKPNGSRKNRNSYNWRIYSTQATFLLNKILPYLIIKKEHAKLALEFQKYVANGRFSLSKKMSKQRTKIALKLRKLNFDSGKAIARKIKGAVR